MTRARLAAALPWLQEAWETGAPLAALPEDARPRTLAEGYRLQAMMAGVLGHKVAGWRIAGVGKAARALVGARRPFAGRIFASRILRSGAVLPGRAMRVRGVAPVYAVELSRDLPPRAAPYTSWEVAQAVGCIRPAIEVVEPRWTEWRNVGLPGIVADFAATGFLALGPARRPADTDHGDVEAELKVNGEVAARSTRAAAGEGPLAALVWLANLQRRSDGLGAGQVVSTGSRTGLHLAAPGDRITVRLQGAGVASLAFTG
ncbi:MAG TPA: fumarylacetoacetate hydrolase family protein [Azospirillaceae bacterium]|nr:fumarylacetoacetate hydrolase family protein [Azospirillaceae bacterium]